MVGFLRRFSDVVATLWCGVVVVVVWCGGGGGVVWCGVVWCGVVVGA